MLWALNSTAALILVLVLITLYCVHEYMRDRIWAPSLMIWLSHVALLYGSNVILRASGNYTAPTGFYTIWSGAVYAHAMLSVLGLIWVDRKVASEAGDAASEAADAAQDVADGWAG